MSEGKWHEDIASAGNYVSTKIGCDITLTIIDIKKVVGKSDYEPKTKDTVCQGFVFEFIGEQGAVTASTYALQGALKDADVAIGDTINIKHPAQGEYIVTKV